MLTSCFLGLLYEQWGFLWFLTSINDNANNTSLINNFMKLKIRWLLQIDPFHIQVLISFSHYAESDLTSNSFLFSITSGEPHWQSRMLLPFWRVTVMVITLPIQTFVKHCARYFLVMKFLCLTIAYR